jgi:hypothetical protein
MPIQRLGLANPAANTDATLATFASPYLVSVVVANKATVANPVTKVSIWLVPSNATIAAQYAYICFNLTLSVGQSFETFRFAANAGDTLVARSSTATTSFSANGIAQNDQGQPENVAQTFTNKVIRGSNNTLYLDLGTTAQRSASVETGYVRFNTETNKVEAKVPGGWENVDKPAALTTDTTTFVGLYEDTTGTTGPKTSTSLTYNATTGALGATSISTPTVSSAAALTLSPASQILNDAPMRLMSRTVAELAALTVTAGAIVYVSNETGGAVVAFYDGTNWRRVTDRAVVS